MAHPELGQLARHFYPEGKKVVPIELLEKTFTPLSLAIWVMDDGASDRGQARINTQAFSLREVSELAAFLWRRFAIYATVNMDKGMPRLRIAARSMSNIRGVLGPLMRPELRYKLGIV